MQRCITIEERRTRYIILHLLLMHSSELVPSFLLSYNYIAGSVFSNL